MTKTLQAIAAGTTVKITAIRDMDVATQALRLGISIGESVTCIAKIPAGPTVIQRGGMELALGQGLCEQIEVEAL